MSNRLAIATVTATIQRILQSAIHVDVESAKVTTVRPSDLGNGTPEAGVNLYLYEVKHNPAWRNTADSSTRRTRGELVKPRVGIDLYYILSFYGNDLVLEPQRMMGSALSVLQERKVLTPQMILETLTDPNLPFLSGSNLADQIELVKLMLLDLPAEERSNLWSVFFQNAHNLSVIYQASAVLIECEDMPDRALPVRDRTFGPVILAQQPIVDQVVSIAGSHQPILADSTLLIHGKQLGNQITKVRINGVEVTPQQVSDTQISLQLASVPANSLRAGVQTLQVVHQVMEATASRVRRTQATPVIYRQVESTAAAFVLHPTIRDISIDNLEYRPNLVRSADLTLQLDLVIGKTQRVVVLLNEHSVNTPAAYSFAVPPRDVDSNSIVVAIGNVKAGSYLVRVQVDGAESLLSVSTNPDTSNTNGYIGPKVNLLHEES